MVRHWAVQGPLKVPCDFWDSARLFLPFLKNLLSKSSEHHGTRSWSLFYFTKAQGTLMDHHGHPNGPLNGPSKTDFMGPLLKNGQKPQEQ